MGARTKAQKEQDPEGDAEYARVGQANILTSRLWRVDGVAVARHLADRTPSCI